MGRNKDNVNSKKTKNKKEHFNDLLLPLLCALCVMPFIIFLAVRDTGLSEYLWYSEDGFINDLYAYYRSWFFIVVSICAAIILLLRLTLYKERTRNVKLYLPLLIYAVLTAITAFVSGHYETVFTGNLYRYEGLLVLVCYIVISFFSYQIMEKERDYRTVRNAVLLMFGALTVIGAFQLAKHDLLNYEWVQSLVMNDEQFAKYGGLIEDVFTGNNVFLTLFNPNYCGVFLTMFTALFFVLALTEKEKKWKIVYAVSVVVAVVFVWFTYSRATLIALVVALIVSIAMMGRKQMAKGVRYVVPVIIGIAVVLVIADGINDFKYLSRWIDTPEERNIESIYTHEDGVWLTCEGQTFVLSIEERTDADNEELVLKVTDAQGKIVEVQADESGEYTLPFSQTEALCTVMDLEGRKMINMLLEDYSLAFVQQGEAYYYLNEVGKLDQMVEIEAVDMHGLEYLGSGRLYIWSRTLPLLKNYIFTGAGPDRFVEAFPQNDYVGKMIYANKTSRIIEGAHNQYLTIWVQTGLLSLIALLAFYVLLIKRCWSGYRAVKEHNLATRIGLGSFIGCICYMVCGLFNDSTLYTTPVFFIFAGLALANAITIKK